MSKVIIITASAALVAALGFPVIAMADGGGQPPRATVAATPTTSATPTSTPAATPTPTTPPEPQVLGAQSDSMPPSDRLLLAGVAGFVALRLMIAAGRKLSRRAS